MVKFCSKVKKMFLSLLGIVWAAPVTVIALLYVLTFWALRYYQFKGVVGGIALCWEADMNKSPKWLQKLWKNWGGHALGNVVVLKKTTRSTEKLIHHEVKHVYQVMRLGIFQPVLYGLSALAIKLGCTELHPYSDNPFEVDATRYAYRKIKNKKKA